MYFLDNASTTPCFEQSAQIVKTALVEDFFNPSAKYGKALEMQNKLNACRDEIKKTLGAINYNVIFTASATESNNLVFASACAKHYTSLVSVGEHSSIFETAKSLTANGCKVETLNLTENGEVDFNDFCFKMNEKVGFVSLMFVSNETGAINNIEQFVNYAKSVNPKVLIHIDAVQGYCKLPICLEQWGVDYLTVSSHKINGPKGVGALIAKNKTKVSPQILGGGQENGFRSGTENLPGILGFANSAKIHSASLSENFTKMQEYKKQFYNTLMQKADESGLKIELNGSLQNSSPYILSLSFVGLRAEILLHKLEEHNIFVGTGSACNSKHSGNRVLENMGKTASEVQGNIRISFSAESLKYNINELTSTIIECANSIQRKN